MSPNQLTIQFAQHHQPWTVSYSPEINLGSKAIPHVMGSHNALHCAKTAGKLCAVFEALDHRSEPIYISEVQIIKDMAADLLAEALRFANLYGFDLATEFVRRVEEKNAVNILNLETKV